MGLGSICDLNRSGPMHVPASILRPALFTALIAAALAASATTAPGEVQRDVVYVPTPHEVVEHMMEMAEVKAGDYVIDFGCGDGRMVIAAAKIGARGYGVDIDPERIEEANANAKEAGVTDKVEFEVANLFDKDLGDADVMAMYLLTEINLKLRPKILSDMKPGARIVSHAFGMGEWEADKSAVVDGKRVFMWYVPAKVEGRWQLKQGDQALSLDLRQDFQKVSGTIQAGETTGRITEGRLTGKKLEFTAELNGQKHRFVGEVDDGQMRGSDGTWTASAIRRL
jgi:SAM-dependent methyltransferase